MDYLVFGTLLASGLFILVAVSIGTVTFRGSEVNAPKAKLVWGLFGVWMLICAFYVLWG